MRYLSVCSGIESASVAWAPLNWEPVAFAEIDKFCSAVLAHYYPEVPNWGDITRHKEWPDAAFDVLVAGFPCQSFSIAGLRKGLGDPRGNLALICLAIADRYRPRWVVFENVPGLLSSVSHDAPDPCPPPPPVDMGRDGQVRVKNNPSFDAAMAVMPERRNKRTVWTVGTEAFSEAHFATFPTELIKPCVLAGCPPGGTVLDPFGGAGTTGLVADRLQRNAILIELSESYVAMARRRVAAETPLFAEAAE